MDFYYNSICHVCKIPSANLKRCTSCKFVAYCSKAHQVCDWKNHKKVCRIITAFRKFYKLVELGEYSTWRMYRLQLKSYLELNLGRSLLTHESQMWMFPRYCRLCYSSECCEDCYECFCVAYCSFKHKELDRRRHSNFCSKLKLGLDLDRYQITNPNINVRFRKVNPNVHCLPKVIQEAIDLFLDISELNYIEKILVTDMFASILTIVYSLEMCNLLIDRNILKESLVLHIVGADNLEMSLNWEYITHFLEVWIKNLSNCEIILIGPDLRFESRELLSDKIKFLYFNDLYHNVIEMIQKPDIVIAFNSGFHEYYPGVVNDTWNKSLSKLIQSNAPLLMTAYTRSEIEEDLKRFNSFSISHILSTRKNPFSNLRPIRDWDSPENEPFHVNGYITIIAEEEYSKS